MKLQSLAVIFAVIIIPIVIVLSTYINNMIDVQNKQASLDSALMNSTFDAVRAYQINTINNSFSSVNKSRERDVRAAVNTYFNSLASALNLSGYTKVELADFTPAILFNLYDGFYVYGPFENYASVSGTTVNYSEASDGNIQFGLKPYCFYSCEYSNGNYDIIINYTLDNYISVSGSYKDINDGNKTKYITASGYYINTKKLDNNNDGQIDRNTATQTVYLYGKDAVKPEELGEYIQTYNRQESKIEKPTYYRYVNYNEEKYYFDMNPTEAEKESMFESPALEGEKIPIFYLNNNVKIYINDSMLSELVKNRGAGNARTFATNPADASSTFQDVNAYQYYCNAFEFTKKVEPILKNIDLYKDIEYEKQKSSDTQNNITVNLSDCVIKTKSYHEQYKLTESRTFGNMGVSSHIKTIYDDRNVFDVSNDNDPELETSSFNQHRADVISSIIEYELAYDIANFNKYINNSFYYQMPALAEDDWYKISNNVTVVSFLQGLVVGNYKYYSNYDVVVNTKQKEFVPRDAINIQYNYEKLGSINIANNATNLNFYQTSASNGAYHDSRCVTLHKDKSTTTKTSPVVGYRTVDYEQQNFTYNNNSTSYYQQPGTAAYECIVSSYEDKLSYDDLMRIDKPTIIVKNADEDKIRYSTNGGDTGTNYINDDVRYAYIKALAREKGASYNNFDNYMLSNNVKYLNNYSTIDNEVINNSNAFEIIAFINGNNVLFNINYTGISESNVKTITYSVYNKNKGTWKDLTNYNTSRGVVNLEYNTPYRVQVTVTTSNRTYTVSGDFSTVD